MKEFLKDNIELPTPWEKADYDSMDYKWQKERRELNDKIADLKKNHASDQQIIDTEQEYALKDKLHADNVDAYLQNSKYSGMVGAFEGAGYVSNGLYRHMIDCIMFSKGDKPFCKVCDSAIIKVINSYTE